MNLYINCNNTVHNTWSYYQGNVAVNSNFTSLGYLALLASTYDSTYIDTHTALPYVITGLYGNGIYNV